MSDQRKDELRNEGVTLLGNQHTVYSNTYNPGVLETFQNKYPDHDYVVTFDAYELTTTCPLTHQPDFAKIIISYIPNERMVESKSLKLFLFSFREEGNFHEEVVNRIKDDLVNLMDPKYLEVRGIFSPRGGISIYPLTTYANPRFDYQDFERARMLQNLTDAANRTVKYDS